LVCGVAKPIGGVACFLAESSYELTIGYIDYARPGHTVTSVGPGIDNTPTQASKFGATRLKILGGYSPLTLEATGRAM
jgi:hypothetical protein